MIDFDEELKKYKPNPEVEEAERDIYQHDITDMTDVLQQIIAETKGYRNGML